MRSKYSRLKIFGVSALSWIFLLLMGLAVLTSAQQILPVRTDRWLEVQQLTGSVTYRRGQTSQPAQLRTRLERIGDTLVTGRSSSARLIVDTGVGTLNVSENTTVQVQQLDTAPDGGRITKLQVTGGQVQIQVRPFTHPNSELQIQTPAGISGVRGTQFGVSVQPNGNTGVATLEGNVVTAAQNQQVDVDAGLQTLVISGEPPLPPTPLRDDPFLDLRFIAAIEGGKAQIKGEIDPVNLLVIAEQTQIIDRNGGFDLQVPLTSDRRIRVTVITPLGNRQIYEVIVP